MMNRPEFLRGWMLLTAQPWGRSYRSDPNSTSSEPSPAKIQAELYYKALSFAFPPAWVEVAELLAAGDKWPSISECKEAIRHAKAKQPSIGHVAGGPEYTEKEAFGIELWEAVKTIAALRHANDPHKAEYREMLTAQFHALTDAEQQQLLRRYPDVAGL